MSRVYRVQRKLSNETEWRDVFSTIGMTAKECKDYISRMKSIEKRLAEADRYTYRYLAK